MSRLFQSETVDGINELADVLSLHCGASFEDAIHYFLECPLYLNERRTLLSNCDDINISIREKGKQLHFHIFFFSLIIFYCT
jgi:hypothetical protein